LDYSVWALFSNCVVYREKVTDMDHLKEVLNSCWDMISQELVDGAIDQWSKRLTLVIRSHGGLAKHHFILRCRACCKPYFSSGFALNLFPVGPTDVFKVG